MGVRGGLYHHGHNVNHSIPLDVSPPHHVPRIHLHYHPPGDPNPRIAFHPGRIGAGGSVVEMLVKDRHLCRFVRRGAQASEVVEVVHGGLRWYSECTVTDCLGNIG